MPKKILLADDSITIQKVIGLTFANEDVELTVVDNGDEAIIKAKEVIPDLIIADVVMPGKDGYEVCYSSKNDPSLAHVPVLLLTGTFETFDETMATKVGADGYITKPFESQALIDKVNELIGNAEQKRAALSAADLGADLGAPAGGFEADGLEAGAELLEAVEPLDAIEPVEDFAPLEEIAPVEELGALELEETAAPAPVEEEDPMEGFGHLTPDPEETSFADISLDEPASETAVSHDDLVAADPEPAEAAAAAPEAPVAPVAEAPSAQASEDGSGWNLSDFNDYMAESERAEAAAQAAADDLPAPVEEAPVEDLSAPEPAFEAAAEFESAPEAAAEPIAEPIAEFGGADTDFSSADPSVGDFGSVDSFAASEEPAPADDFAAPAFDAADDNLPAPVEAQSGAVAGEFAEAPAQAEEETAPATAFDEPAQELEETPFETGYDAPAQAPARPGAIELSPDDGELELTPVAPQPDMPLEQVAEMYPLDDAPAEAAPVELAPAESADAGFAVEPPMTEELVDEEPAEQAPAFEIAQAPEEAPVAETAPAVEAAPASTAAAPAIDTAALEQQLGRIPELIEGCVRSMLDNDALLATLGDKTGKLVEAKIEEAIRKVAPDIIEQLVKKALADATERILNETIGRLRNG